MKLGVATVTWKWSPPPVRSSTRNSVASGKARSSRDRNGSVATAPSYPRTYDAPIDTETAARRWIETWSAAWPAADVEALASVYADDAPFRSRPFGKPDTLRSYLARAFAEEDLVEARFGEPVVSGNRAAVEYWAVLRGDEGEVTIAGAAFLRFSPDGRVLEHRDYWEQRAGVAEPPAGWGR